ncbi:MAG: hypothetical protein ACYDCM_07165 [Candidatus Acidiferrales bacterium]
MAYPFARMPTYAELKGRLQKEFGCKYAKAEGTLTDPQGNKHDVYYFERVVGDKTLRANAPDLKDDERVLWSVIRSLCARLKIDPAPFGLTLG